MIEILDWGLIDYEEALKRQEELVETVAEKKSPGFLIFCTHPPIVTLGRKTQAGDVFAWNGPVREIARGGRATYHGPSQLVVYPILNLELKDQKWPYHDIGWQLQTLEKAIIQTLEHYNLKAVGKSLQSPGGEETGVWVENRKVASVGIGVRKWVTMHGAAINLDQDPMAFTGMNPCGFKKEVMVSLEELAKKKIDRENFKTFLKNELSRLF